MSYDIYVERSNGLQRIGNTRLRYDQFLPGLPELAKRHGLALVVHDQHRRVVATVSAEGDLTTLPALHQPTR